MDELPSSFLSLANPDEFEGVILIIFLARESVLLVGSRRE
jgi:hypothetical protein